MKTMQQRLESALPRAISSRGRAKGMLLSKCPPINTDEAAVWQGIMTKANPYKVGLGHILFMTPDRRELMDYTMEWLEKKGINARGLDRDAKALSALGLM